jgi:small subunit ribosomal protein S3
MAIAASMRMNAEGIKVLISGRLNGAEMARSEGFKEGSSYQLSELILIMH